MALGRLGSKIDLGRLGSKMGLGRGSKMALGRLGSKIALGRLDTRQNGSESENTRQFGCEAQLGTLALGRTHHFTYTPVALPFTRRDAGREAAGFPRASLASLQSVANKFVFRNKKCLIKNYLGR